MQPITFVQRVSRLLQLSLAQIAVLCGLNRNYFNNARNKNTSISTDNFINIIDKLNYKLLAMPRDKPTPKCCIDITNNDEDIDNGIDKIINNDEHSEHAETSELIG